MNNFTASIYDTHDKEIIKSHFIEIPIATTIQRLFIYKERSKRLRTVI